MMDAARWLEGLLDQERYPRLHAREVGLARIRGLLSRAGHPERAFPTVLVGGTKGKGSTAAMLAAVQHAAGVRVGLYVKPHLVDYRERIRVGDDLIAEGALEQLIQEIRPLVDAMAVQPDGAPTYFEVFVALALQHFRRRAVDLAILEVGLGGRLDATNACDPMLSVLTPISLDHVDVLGETLAAIAREKAGIMRPGRPVVTAPQPPEAEGALAAACRAAGARMISVAQRTRWAPGEMTDTGQDVHLSGAEEYGWLRLPLIGRHQIVNAATAVVAAEELTQAGFPGGAAAVRAGLGGLAWPGRVEVVRRRPIVVVDVAHNQASMQALRDALMELWPRRRIVLVFGMVATHDHRGPAEVIAPLAETAIITVPRHVRPLPARTLAQVVAQHTGRVEIIEDREAAVDRALALAGPDDLVCVTGSFYLAGEARAYLLPHEGAHLLAREGAPPERKDILSPGARI